MSILVWLLCGIIAGFLYFIISLFVDFDSVHGVYMCSFCNGVKERSNLNNRIYWAALCFIIGPVGLFGMCICFNIYLGAILFDLIFTSGTDKLLQILLNLKKINISVGITEDE